ncbi:MAG: apolipoprotein N-acyltransferase [Verrucomicrobiota bacterium]
MISQKLLGFALAFISGILLFASFPPLDWSWAGWIALTPVTIGMIVLDGEKRQVWLEGLILSSTFFFSTLIWVTEVSWIGWILLTLIMLPYPVAWMIVTERVLRGAQLRLHSFINLYRAALCSLLWVGLEWMRGWAFSGFPWNYIGASQYRMVAVIQIAEWGGVLLISWLVVFISMVLGLTCIRIIRETTRKQKMRPHFEFTLSMLLVGLVLLFGIHVLLDRTESVKEITALAVQPNIPQDPWKSGMSVKETVAKLEVLSISGLNQSDSDIDLIVWPETPVGQEIYVSPYFREALQAITIQRNIPLIMGSIIVTGPKLYNAALLYPAGGGPPQVYYKNHLVLMGEYVPLPENFPLRNYFIPLGQNFTEGTTKVVFSLFDKDVRLAPLICFEDVFSNLARGFVSGNPDIFVNLTNDGWFNRSFESRQHLANSVFRAVENRRPLLRVSNNGVTALIDHKGILREDAIFGNFSDGSYQEAGTLKVTIEVPGSQRTVYQQFGDWIGYLGAGALILVVGQFYLRPRIGFLNLGGRQRI